MEPAIQDHQSSFANRELRKARLLVFDLDGTLINSSLDLCIAVNAALRHVGRHPLTSAQISSYIGDGAAALMERALLNACPMTVPSARQEADPLREAISYFLLFYRKHKLDNTAPYPGVLETLQEIRAAHPNLPMAVLTNKPVGPSLEICEGLGLAQFFFQIYGGDSFATKKPNPEGLQRLVAEANLPHLRLALEAPILFKNTVMIGDSHVDVETARHCGVRSLGCLYGFSPALLQAAGPDQVVSQPSEWKAALAL